MSANGRAYEESHPWITFNFETRSLGEVVWAHLGESYSKCQHLIGAPLQPRVAWDLARVYMRRGALASAAIEGNTLSEDEVNDILDNKRRLPESQQYLEQEVLNVLNALRSVRQEVWESDGAFRLSPDWILGKHSELMEALDVAEHVNPGAYRDVAIVVGNYRGAPAADVPYLMEELCRWVNAILDDAASKRDRTPDQAFFLVFFAATLAHLYLAWIHPFGDGNGRTARLIECAILAHCGLVPWVSTNLLSDYYNRTRSRYYERLDAASRSGDVAGFVGYSALGLRDQLREQIRAVQDHQRRVAWINYVHERFQSEPSTDTARRRRAVVLAMPDGEPLSRKQIRYLTPTIAEMYDGASERLFRRDMSKLVELQLVEEVSSGKYESCIWRMDAFTPRPELGVFAPVLEQLPPEPAP
ncbi:Fic family protein [Microbacterium caowuchunii]|uniref:Fic family protein n=1 Tax=Microbacterium caowuchunii TaxID=2614638 RepID=A0A5N0THY6_9MICO|nr:Fic family protein [Microbacterium caowuchunii]KAA9133717.1 Fic family protein [Microbacterium caowuchunii]